jgi:uncharacterized protein
VEVLEDTLLAFRLPAFESKLRVRERRHPKLYFVDPGLVRALKKQLGPLTAEETGPLLEGWVASVLRAYAAYRDLFDELFYWRPADAEKTDVDFLLRKGNRHLALEVKSGRRVSGVELRGLRAVRDLPGLARRVLVYTGHEALRTEDGIEVWPVARFLDALAEGTLWPARGGR